MEPRDKGQEKDENYMLLAFELGNLLTRHINCGSNAGHDTMTETQ